MSFFELSSALPVGWQSNHLRQGKALSKPPLQWLRLAKSKDCIDTGMRLHRAKRHAAKPTVINHAKGCEVEGTEAEAGIKWGGG
jgi:hypothetical protein